MTRECYPPVLIAVRVRELLDGRAVGEVTLRPS
jgi:hypothetical protein